VTVDGFWMDETPVTNAEFAEFVDETGYTTFPERNPNPEDYPGAEPDDLVPGSAVFTSPDGPVNLQNPNQWWSTSRTPIGSGRSVPDSSLEGLLEHPSSTSPTRTPRRTPNGPAKNYPPRHSGAWCPRRA